MSLESFSRNTCGMSGRKIYWILMKVIGIDLQETKNHLAKIVRRVQAGERFYILRRGKPVAEIRPVDDATVPLERGCARNDRYFMSDDFDAQIPDLGDYV